MKHSPWEWDPKKARANQIIHGISFEEAEEALNSGLSETKEDREHSTYEQRYHTIGITLQSRTILVVHTWQEDTGTGRIISAREPTPQERRRYESGNF